VVCTFSWEEFVQKSSPPTGVEKRADFIQFIVGTTVPSKAITFPTEAKLAHRAR
jgi:hypothetical protein